MTSLRRLHREFVLLLIVGASVILAAGTADAAVTTTLPDNSVAGVGSSSVPLAPAGHSPLL